MNGVTSSCLKALSQWAMQAAGVQVRLTVNLEWNNIDDPVEVGDCTRFRESSVVSWPFSEVSGALQP